MHCYNLFIIIIIFKARFLSQNFPCAVLWVGFVNLAPSTPSLPRQPWARPPRHGAGCAGLRQQHQQLQLRPAVLVPRYGHRRQQPRGQLPGHPRPGGPRAQRGKPISRGRPACQRVFFTAWIFNFLSGGWNLLGIFKFSRRCFLRKTPRATQVQNWKSQKRPFFRIWVDWECSSDVRNYFSPGVGLLLARFYDFIFGWNFENSARWFF